MTDPKDARLAFALLKIRQSQISRAIQAVQPFLDQEPGDKNAAKLGRARLGKVTMTEPEVKPVVTDPDAFVKYVQDVRPDEIEPAVRPAFQTALFQHLDKTGQLLDWDGNAVPGVGFGSSTPQQRFYADDGAEELLAVVDPADLPVIEGLDLAAVLGIAHPATGSGEVAGDA